jgi:hypothetical protein
MKKNGNPNRRNLLLVLVGLGMLFVAFVRLSLFSYSSHSYSSDEYVVEDYDMMEAAYDQSDFNDEVNDSLLDVGIQTPLYLQTNEEWADFSYGSDGTQTLRDNGCALLSLSMVLAYLREDDVSPLEVLDWAQDSYYVAEQGTDWRIFSDFGDAFGYTYHDLGTDTNQVATYLRFGHPVIVSVTSGDFTDTGHVMVLAGMQDDHIVVLDPNDTPEKSHYRTPYSLEEIANQSLHFWTFTNDGSSL